MDLGSITYRYDSNPDNLCALEHTIYELDEHEKQQGKNKYSFIKADFHSDIDLFKAYIREGKIHVEPSEDAHKNVQVFAIEDELGEYTNEDFVSIYSKLFAKTIELFQNNDFVIHTKGVKNNTGSIMEHAITQIRQNPDEKNQSATCKLEY